MNRDRILSLVRAPRLMLYLLMAVLAVVPAGGVTTRAEEPVVVGTMVLPEEAQTVSIVLSAGGRVLRNPKLDSPLAALIAAVRVSRANLSAEAGSQALTLSGNRVHVQIVIRDEDAEDVVQAISRAGGEVTRVGNEDTLIQGWLPVDAIEPVTAKDSVYLIRRPAKAVPMEGSYPGDFATEALAVINAPEWHTAGYSGAGVKIGIIDVGFEGYRDLLGGDLPASIAVKSFVDGQGDTQVDGISSHGTACAEIVHDIAPDAALHLARIDTNLDLVDAVAWLRDVQQVDVISTSLGWYNLTPGDGTGEFVKLVQTAHDAGILWITSAGNNREAHWGGGYTDSNGNNAHEFADGEINCFGPGGTDCFTVSPGHRFSIFMRWDDWTDVDQDYDLLLVRWNGTDWDVIARSQNRQDGNPGQTPTEFAVGNTSGDPTAYGFVIQRHDGTEAVNFDLFVPRFLRPREVLHARSLANLADVPAAITVAAIDAASPYPQEPYSSEGPTNGPGGSKTGGFTKPDISAYANVSTVSYGVGRFNGTSAATPHVAGAAALVLSAHPEFTPSQVQSFMEERAVEMGASGMDARFGHGRLHLGEPPACTDLDIAKRVSGKPDLASGGPVTFAISIENRGTCAATDVIVTDTLSASVMRPGWETSSSLAGIAPRGAATPYVWNLPDLAPGASGVITVFGTFESGLVSPGSSALNTTIISGDRAESNVKNNSSAVLVGGSRIYLPLVARERQ